MTGLFFKKISRTERNSSFELLRIIAMLFIIAHHFYVHGNFSELSGGNSIAMLLFNFGGKFGVIIFMLIAGYFGIKSKLKISKIIKLVLQVWFFSFFIYLIFALCGRATFDLTSFARFMFPTISKRYWFATNYIIVYLLSPLINKLLNSLSHKDYLAMLGITFGVYFLLKLTIGIPSNLFVFFLLYILGAYFKLFPQKFINKKWIMAIIILGLYLIILSLQYFVNYNFFATDSLLMIVLGASVFLLFEKITIKSNFINIVARTTFGVYLLHDHELLSPFLWQDLLNVNKFANSGWLFLFGVAIVISVFIVCSLIETARLYGIEQPIERFILKQKSKRDKNKQDKIIVLENNDQEKREDK